MAEAHRQALDLPVANPARKRHASSEVQLAAGRRSVALRLREARLRYFGRLLRHGPPQLRALLDLALLEDASGASRPWLHALVQDLDGMRRTAGCSTLPPPAQHLAAWCARAREPGWSAAVRAAVAEWHYEERQELAGAIWRSSLALAAAAFGLAPPPAALEGEQLGYLCYDCGEVLKSVRAWRRHHRRHEERVPPWHWEVGTACPACLWEFHSRARLCCHLVGAPACFALVRARGRRLGEEERGAVFREDREAAAALRRRGRYERFAELPAFRLEGPLPLPEAAEDVEVCEAAPSLPEVPLDPQSADAGEAFEHLAGAVASRVFAEAARPPPHYVLHLFSGQRRVGDLQWALEEELAERPFQVVTLSVDVVCNPRYGDLRDWGVIRAWAHLLLQGAVVGLAVGPPCETWSAARLLALPGEAHPPRALRSAARPWGLSGLRGREREQLELGSDLLRSALFLATLALGKGVPCVIEHPAEPTWAPEAASIWRLPEVRWLAAQPGAERLLLDQCAFGAEGRKPTGLLAVHCPVLGRLLARAPFGGRCAPGHRHQPLRGRRADGSFVTAPFKQYPPALCRFLAAGLAASFERLGARRGERSLQALDEAVGAFYVPLDPYGAGHEWGEFGADFADRS